VSCLLWSLTGSATGHADLLSSQPIQVSVPVPHALPPAQQLADLERWRRDYADWKTWFLQWQNRREPGVFSSKERRTPPVPPVWLPEMCQSLLEDIGPLADGCRDWRQWSAAGEAADVVAQQTAQSRSQHEAPSKTAWWEHVHLDAIWPMTQAGSSTIGIAGMHTTVHVTDRFQVFLAPGAMFMRVPSVTGEMTWSGAADWGFSYRLIDFRMPLMQRASTLHINLVRVWLLGQHAVESPGEIYLAGFSVTFRKR
jgi:hypothetical protein